MENKFDHTELMIRFHNHLWSIQWITCKGDCRHLTSIYPLPRRLLLLKQVTAYISVHDTHHYNREL
jgi:hypothetical protein